MSKRPLFSVRARSLCVIAVSVASLCGCATELDNPESFYNPFGGNSNTGGGGTTGGSGGDPGGSSGSGGTGGSGGTAITFCDAPTTIFQVEATTTVAGCTGSACHTAANVQTFPPDLTSADPEPRLLDVISDSTFCGIDGTEKYIDKANVANSLLLRVLEANPSCAGGNGTIEQMPFGVKDGNLAPLTPAQKQCIVDWVSFVAAQ